jgi:Divergent InlB B-repeat domain
MFRSQLAGFPDVATVDIFDAGSGTPTAIQLEGYDLVVSFSDAPYNDPVAYGNALADFVDSGGAVIQYSYDNNSLLQPTGRFASGGYPPFIPGSIPNDPTTLGAHDASSPLMQGVSTLNTADNTDPTLAPGATLVASWADGRQAIAYKGRVASVSAYIGDAQGAGIWSGDFARVAVNTVRWLGRHTLTVAKQGSGQGTVTGNKGGIACGATCTGLFAYPDQLTLTAAPATGSSFAGWSGGGCSGKGPCTVTMDATKTVTAAFADIPPRVTSLGLSRHTFRAASKGSSIARKTTAVGTRVRYRVSKPGKARFTIQRPVKGRRKGHKCVAKTKKNRKAQRCTRYVKLKGSFSRISKAGSNSFRFTGRLRRKKLRPGRYRLVLVATDAAKNKSKPKRAKFRIVLR